MTLCNKKLGPGSKLIFDIFRDSYFEKYQGSWMWQQGSSMFYVFVRFTIAEGNCSNICPATIKVLDANFGDIVAAVNAKRIWIILEYYFS